MEVKNIRHEDIKAYVDLQLSAEIPDPFALEYVGKLFSVRPVSEYACELEICTRTGTVKERFNQAKDYFGKYVGKTVRICGKKPANYRGGKGSAVCRLDLIELSGYDELFYATFPEDLADELLRIIDEMPEDKYRQLEADAEKGGSLPAYIVSFSLVCIWYALTLYQYSPELQKQIGAQIELRKKSSMHDVKKLAEKKTALLVGHPDRVSKAVLEKDAAAVFAEIDREFPGQKALKARLCSDFLQFQRTPGNPAPKMPLLIPDECTDLIRLFGECSGLGYAEFNLTGLSDPIVIAGTPGGYDNASPGPFAAQFLNGAAVGCLRYADCIGNPEKICPEIQAVLQRNYRNEMLEIPLNLNSTFLFVTCRNPEKLPKQLADYVEFAPFEDFSEEEQRAFFDVCYRQVCRELNIPEGEICFDEETKKLLALRYILKNSISDIRTNIKEVLRNAWSEGGADLGDNA